MAVTAQRKDRLTRIIGRFRTWLFVLVLGVVLPLLGLNAYNIYRNAVEEIHGCRIWFSVSPN